MKTVYFIRHGEAAHNVGYTIDGEIAYYSKKYVDSALTGKGIDQCNEAKMKMLDKPVDVVLTSPLKRTLQTGTIIFGDRDIEFHAVEELRELNYNHPCNMRSKKSEMKPIFPHVNFDSITEMDEWYANGDPYNKYEAFLKILKERKENSIAVVSHYDFLMKFLPIVGYPQPNVDNCQIIVVEL